MPSRPVVRVRAADDGVAADTLRAGIAEIQREHGVSPSFPPAVEQAAQEAARSPRLPDLDRTDVPFVTLDPAGSTDLDQALHLERDGDGYVVRYAIADVAAFVTPGDPVDVEAHRRGETLYAADSRIPLHPTVLSEGAASLLPDLVRPALLWTIRLDPAGEATEAHVERARVRSTAQLSYDAAQRSVDAGTPLPGLELLREVGELLLAREAARGGVSLPLPEQEVVVEGDRWRLEFREQRPVEQWNAQLSLLTGMAAGSLMVRGRIGLLRTLPPPDPRDLERLRRTADALGVPWPPAESYSDFIRSLDPARPAHAAMVNAAAALLRGSGYVAFDGELPERHGHAAVAADYAHVTAPLRRLGDRYAGEVCLALCAGEPVPDWARSALPDLAKVLRSSAGRAASYERAVLDLVEAGVLRDRVGETFDAVVVGVDGNDGRRGVVTLLAPAVETHVVGDRPLPLGTAVQVRLTEADVERRRVTFSAI